MLSAPLWMVATLISTQPTPEQVKAVLDHYFLGTGVVLADAVLCKTIEKEDEVTKWDCKEAYGLRAVKGDTVFVYLTFLVPKGETKDLMIQAAHDGTVRTTKDITVKGTYFRHRLFRAFTLQKLGRWDFHIRDADEVLHTLSIEAI